MSQTIDGEKWLSTRGSSQLFSHFPQPIIDGLFIHWSLFSGVVKQMTSASSINHTCDWHVWQIYQRLAELDQLDRLHRMNNPVALPSPLLLPPASPADPHRRAPSAVSVSQLSFFLSLSPPPPSPPPPKKKENLTLNQSNHSRLPVSHRSTQPMNFIQFQFNSNVELNNQSQLRWQLAQSNGEWGGGKLAKMSLIGRLSGRTAAEIMAAWVAATPPTPPIISPQLARECHWIKWIMALIGQSMGNGTGSAPLDTYRQIRTVCTHPSSQCHKSTRCNITIGQIKHSECGW